MIGILGAAGIAMAPEAVADKGKNLRIIMALEPTVEDPEIRIHICTEDRAVLLNGKRKNPRLALAVGIADVDGYGNVTVFSELSEFLILGINLDPMADGLVIHAHDPNGSGEGETVTEETFSMTQNTVEGELTGPDVEESEKVVIANIPMDPDADPIDVDDAIELVKRAALIPDKFEAGTLNPGEVFLTWRSVDPDSGDDKYSLYRSTSPGVTQETGTKVLDEVEFTTDPIIFIDTGLAPGTYFYVVTAIQDDGMGGTRESLDSPEESALAL